MCVSAGHILLVSSAADSMITITPNEGSQGYMSGWPTPICKRWKEKEEDITT
jgi:hypothetical protein